MRKGIKGVLNTSIISLLLVGGNITMSYGAYKTLSVPQQKQTGANSCWASCASMTSAYFKGNSNNYEKTIFNYIKGNISMDTTSARGNVSDVVKGVKYITGIGGFYKTTPPTYTDCKNQVNKNGTIVTVRKDSEPHMIVLKGYDDENNWVLYNDPATGKGHRASYAYMVNSMKINNSGYWR